MLNTQRKLENFNHQTVYMVTKLGFIEPVRFESSTDYKKITTTSFPYQTMEFEINELERFIQFINRQPLFETEDAAKTYIETQKKTQADRLMDEYGDNKIEFALYLADTSAEILKNQLLTNYLETADDKHLNELAKKTAELLCSKNTERYEEAVAIQAVLNHYDNY